MTEDEKLSTEASINSIKSEWHNFSARDYKAKEIDVYDIDNAWFHALNELKLPKIAKELNDLTKHERVPRIKEYEEKGYPKLLKKIEDVWLKWVKEFITLNKIDIEDVIAVRFDSISLKSKTPVTKLDINKNVHFSLLDKRGMKPKDYKKNNQKSEESTEGFSETKKTINEIIPEYLSQISDEIESREAVSKKFNSNYDTVIIIRYDGKSKWDDNCMAIQLVYENNDWNVNNTSVSKVFNKKELEEALSHCKNKQKSNAKVLILANENNELRDVLTELNCEFKSLYEILPDRLKKTYPLLTVGEPGSPYPNSQKNMNIDISFFYKAFGDGKIKSLEDLYMSTESFLDMNSLLKGFTSTHETDTEAKKKTKIFKCPVCKKKYNSAKFLENHVSQEHNDMIPREMPVAQYIFNLKNKKEHGNCVICKKPTLWNEKINKYHRFCSDKCKEVYIKEARARLMRVYGTDNLAKDPEHQKKMLENRKISKKYTFSDGGVINCVGSYEYDFIKYCDEVLGLGSKDIIDPSHSDILFRYEFENKERFYIPDYYLPDYNLLVELKDAGDNNHPNIKMHMKAMDNEKFRAVIESNKYNFITICGKDYSKFVELIDYLKSKSLNEKSDDKLIISIDQNVYKQYGLTSNF